MDDSQDGVRGHEPVLGFLGMPVVLPTRSTSNASTSAEPPSPGDVRDDRTEDASVTVIGSLCFVGSNTTPAESAPATGNDNAPESEIQESPAESWHFLSSLGTSPAQPLPPSPCTPPKRRPRCLTGEVLAAWSLQQGGPLMVRSGSTFWLYRARTASEPGVETAQHSRSMSAQAAQGGQHPVL